MAKSNRKQRRKENIKAVKETENEITEKENLWKKFIVALCVICILGLFYLLAIHITNKNSNISYNNDTGSTYIDYEEVLLGNSFNRSPSEYLVVYFDKGNEEEYSTIYDKITEYSSKDASLAIYYVDMSNEFNKAYYTTEESNKAPNDVTELRINGPTLIKISKGKAVEYVEGIDAVSEYLG